MKRVKQRLAGVNRAVIARLRAVLLLVALVNLIVCGVVAYKVYRASETTANESFDNRSRVAIDAISSRLNNYRDLLYAGQAFLNTSRTVDQTEWDDFFRTQSVYERYKGVNSIAYIAAVSPDDYDQYVQQMRGTRFVGSVYQPPAKDSDTMGLLNVYSSTDNVTGAFKRDFFNDEARTRVYKASGKLRHPVASPPVTLATGYEGFFISLPREGTGAFSGYVVAAFRFDELMNALLPAAGSELAYSVSDVSKNSTRLIYRSADYRESPATATHYIDVGDRTWLMKVSDTDEASTQADIGAPLILVISGLLVVATVITINRKI